MRSTLLLAVAAFALAGCGDDQPEQPIKNGEPCPYSSKCEDGDCHRGVCRARYSKLGEACGTEADDRSCELEPYRLRCYRDRCVEPEVVRAAEEMRMLEESGAGPPAAELGKAAATAHPGSAVRVVETRGEEWALAACRADERLTFGRCHGWRLTRDEPEGHSAVDTVGARWVCEAESGEVSAMALCAALGKVS